MLLKGFQNQRVLVKSNFRWLCLWDNLVIICLYGWFKKYQDFSSFIYRRLLETREWCGKKKLGHVLIISQLDCCIFVNSIQMALLKSIGTILTLLHTYPIFTDLWVLVCGIFFLVPNKIIIMLIKKTSLYYL